jgi:hypothetical protein
MREWDRKNEDLHGNHRSYVVEYRLRRDSNGNVFIGETPIIGKEALAVASKYV